MYIRYCASLIFLKIMDSLTAMFLCQHFLSTANSRFSKGKPFLTDMLNHLLEFLTKTYTMLKICIYWTLPTSSGLKLDKVLAGTNSSRFQVRNYSNYPNTS